MCVGCRQREAQAGLLRVVAASGEVIPDPDRRQPGRGAYLHRDPGCLAQAERRRALTRALRVPGPLDLTVLRTALDPTGTEHGTTDPATAAGSGTTGPATAAGLDGSGIRG